MTKISVFVSMDILILVYKRVEYGYHIICTREYR